MHYLRLDGAFSSISAGGINFQVENGLIDVSEASAGVIADLLAFPGCAIASADDFAAVQATSDAAEAAAKAEAEAAEAAAKKKTRGN